MLFHEHSCALIKKHGKTYVKYEGVHPTLVTIDPELIKLVLVKNFDSFSDVLELQVKL